MKIVLLCNLGMSTGVMQLRLEEEAALHGIEASIIAMPVTDIDKQEVVADVFLLGPQIRYAEADVRSKAEGAFVYVMSPTEFGLMQADAIWEKIKEHFK